MEYRNLGDSGLKVSSICLGAMTFGEPDSSSFMHGLGCGEDTSFSIMDRAVEAGVNFIDVADVYGEDGLSERVVGRWLAQEGRRDRVVLATKFRFKMADGPNGTGASRLRIVRACEASLRRLGTDRIDLYQVHMQDIETPEEETLRALDDLVRAGKVLYTGCSNYAAYRLVDSLWRSRTGHLERYVALQAQYSLLVRDIERELVPACRDHGLGILPWSPLASGLLSGKYHRDQPPPAGSRLDRWRNLLDRHQTDRTWKILDAVRAVAAETGATAPQVSLAWLLGRPHVSSVIIGARTLAQLDDNLGAADLGLTDAQRATLDEASDVTPGYPYDFIKQVQGRW